MANENQNDLQQENHEVKVSSELASKKNYLVPASILISSLILAGAWVYTTGLNTGTAQKTGSASNQEQTVASELEGKVLPTQGVELPAVWGDLGAQLVSTGVIDADKFKAIYEQRGQFTDEYKNLLLGDNNSKLKMTSSNSSYLLNLLWALGLGNKNAVLDEGEMVKPAYGGAKNFASTGGWTVAKGKPMDHYSRHQFFNLTPEQQALVEKVAKGIYRPCCGNSTYFPDCNHGMAMLGLLELMASQNVSEQEMWQTALAVNSYWFPNNYLTIATYMQNKGVDWKDVKPQELLGINYSSSRGYASIAAQVVQPQQNGGTGGGCAVDSGAATQQPQQPGCSI